MQPRCIFVTYFSLKLKHIFVSPSSLFQGVAGGQRRIVINPNQLPHIHQEPAMLLCVGLLLLLIGRIIYLQGSTDSQDHSQV